MAPAADIQSILKRRNAFLEHSKGRGLCGNQQEEAPAFSGERRHDEPLDDLLLDFDVSLLGPGGIIPQEGGDLLLTEPRIGAESHN